MPLWVKELPMRSGVLVATVFAGFFLALGSVISAQTGTTSLRGTVSDPSGAAVPNARVTLAGADRGFERTIMSSGTGSYEFLQLQPGTYDLTVEMAGFSRHQQNAIKLLVDTP